MHFGFNGLFLCKCSKGRRIYFVAGHLRYKRLPAHPPPCICDACKRLRLGGLKRVGIFNPGNGYLLPLSGFHPEMALFCNFGINHAKDVTGLAESLV